MTFLSVGCSGRRSPRLGHEVLEHGDLIEEQDQYLFSISCVDVPETIEDESLECPLSRMIWEVDEENTTTRAKAQVFVGHTGTARSKGGALKGPGSK